MTIDDQIDHPIVGEAGQGLARGLDPHQLTRHEPMQVGLLMKYSPKLSLIN